MRTRLLSSLVLLSLAASCAGTRTSGDLHTTHAESFHLFGMTIPEDDHERAWQEVPADADKETILDLALAREKIQPWLEGKEVVKKIYVPGKLVSVVVK